MSTVIAITEVTSVTQRGVPCWSIRRQQENGVYLHLLPHAAMSWRAAEYGIDPAATDLLLDIVLYEHHMPPAEQVPNLMDRLAQAKAAVQIGPAEGMPDPLDVIRDHYNSQLAEAA